MKIVVQRSKNSKVVVDNKITGEIEKGLVVLVGFTHTDTEKEIDYMVNKIINLRVFDDEDGVMNKSLTDIGGNVLSISQFTLYGNATKGRRPSYVDAMKPDEATKMYDLFNKKLREQNIIVETGVFGADMQVSIQNDGPVTIIIDSTFEK